MSRILVIGFNTFRETLRDKVLYNLVIFALLLIGSSILLVRLNYGDSAKLILDLGLAKSVSDIGKDVKLAVIDDGFDLAHEEISAKIVASKNFGNAQIEPFCSGRGSRPLGSWSAEEGRPRRSNLPSPEPGPRRSRASPTRRSRPART